MSTSPDTPRIGSSDRLSSGYKASDKYKIIAKINEGSYGKVYAAKCFKTNKIVALKAEIK